LSTNNKVVTKTSGRGWNAGVLGVNRNQSFRVKIIARGIDGAIMVGFGTTSFNPGTPNFNTNGWFLCVNNCQIYSKAASRRCMHVNAVQNSGVIEVLLDRNKHQISFVVNGIATGAFLNIPNEDLFPALDIHDTGASIELI